MSAEVEIAKLRAAANAIRQTAFLSDNNLKRLTLLEDTAVRAFLASKEQSDGL